MFFAILAIVLTVLFMCIPVAALVVVHRSSVKLMKPLGAGITAILASSVISAVVLLLYEDGGIHFLQTGWAAAIRWILLGAVEAMALYAIYKAVYKGGISLMEAVCVSVGMCIPMLYSRALSVVMTHIQLVQQGVSAADGWQFFYLTLPSVIMVFFQPIMAIFMAIIMRRGRWYIGAAAYAVMSALCYNMNEICTVLGAGGWLKIVIWIILLAAALMQVYYIKQHYKELPQPAAKANGAHTRLKDDKYAWPDESAFFDGDKPKQIHNGGKKKK